MGVHYTPPALARFVADRLLAEARRGGPEIRRVLDPACGDGALLSALLLAMRVSAISVESVVGVEADPSALSSAQSKLSDVARGRLHLVGGDFLELVVRLQGEMALWESRDLPACLQAPFDAVIANPPYVRTQLLGRRKSRRLAAEFSLSGRVDLYHAFIVAATESLRPGGILGIITSNRFLTTLAGRAIRTYLSEQYDISEIIDLGDTKLFEAAVLPAIVIARRRERTAPRTRRPAFQFLKVYAETGQPDEPGAQICSAKGVLEILDSGESGCFKLSHGVFRVTRGHLMLDKDPAKVWALTTPGETEWVRRVRQAAAGVFADVADVRVGIKTTADDVFIRMDWDELPPQLRPEPALLRPLLTHEHARRWAADTVRAAPRILYPHEVHAGVRRAVDLERFPRARAYLESHRGRLERRHYVAEAGRRWFEIWVPQDPAAWSEPKIVFPDISGDPRFYLDLEGRLVNGDCYWITLHHGQPVDMLYLLLGVANSTTIARFHDLVFNNKLYSARRRYITQYVGQYPYPAPNSSAARRLVKLVKRLAEPDRSSASRLDAAAAEREVDALVEQAFGLTSGQDAR
jgi:adenine-specific DNA-methyltransferase